MSDIEIRKPNGESAGTVALDDRMFGAQVNVPVMHQVVRAQLAAARSGTHSTKTRADVRGGGTKPWRQKGTGRARQGSIRAPHWSGGGVVFGPHPRDHSMSVPKKMKAAALRSALSDRVALSRFVVVDAWDFGETPSTKAAAKALETLGATGKVLLVVEGLDVTVGKSFRNLTNVHMLTADQLNTYDVLWSDWVVITKAAVEQLNKRAETLGDTPKDKASKDKASKEAKA